MTTGLLGFANLDFTGDLLPLFLFEGLIINLELDLFLMWVPDYSPSFSCYSSSITLLLFEPAM